MKFNKFLIIFLLTNLSLHINSAEQSLNANRVVHNLYSALENNNQAETKKLLSIINNNKNWIKNISLITLLKSVTVEDWPNIFGLIESVIKHPNANLNELDNEGNTPLLIACLLAVPLPPAGSPDLAHYAPYIKEKNEIMQKIIILLLMNNARLVNNKAQQNLFTCFMYPDVLHAAKEFVKYLLNTDKVDGISAQNALKIADYLKDSDAVNALSEKGIKLNNHNLSWVDFEPNDGDFA